ncbi:MAG: helix-turn-helix domain-containing protein [Treponema sp.]|jgi:transcriptional regulator with XRE-family HTH domain|nr:helix-turn-helix domain-containing protein [Treponema sp.]
MADDKKNEIRDRFIRVRKEYDMNQRQMAEYLGTSPSFVSEIERGSRNPSKNILTSFDEKFAPKYNMRWLLYGTNESGPENEEKDKKINELVGTIEQLRAELREKEKKLNEVNDLNMQLIKELLLTRH